MTNDSPILIFDEVTNGMYYWQIYYTDSTIPNKKQALISTCHILLNC